MSKSMKKPIVHRNCGKTDRYGTVVNTIRSAARPPFLESGVFSILILLLTLTLDFACVYILFNSILNDEQEPIFTYLLTGGVVLILDAVPMVAFYKLKKAVQMKSERLASFFIALLSLVSTAVMGGYQLVTKNEIAPTLFESYLTPEAITHASTLTGVVPFFTSLLSAVVGYTCADPLGKMKMRYKVNRLRAETSHSELSASISRIGNPVALFERLASLEYSRAQAALEQLNSEIGTCKTFARRRLGIRLGGKPSVVELLECDLRPVAPDYITLETSPQVNIYAEGLKKSIEETLPASSAPEPLPEGGALPALSGNSAGSEPVDATDNEPFEDASEEPYDALLPEPVDAAVNELPEAPSEGPYDEPVRYLPDAGEIVI